MNDIVALALSLAIAFGAAAIGGLATARSLRSWYVTLPKPSWNPPNRVFGPVWTLLYLAMGVAAWLVWTAGDGADVAVPLAWYGGQLVLNVAWSVAFFGLRSPVAGVFVIVALWCAIAGTIVSFAPISAAAAALLVPYLAWVTFAMLLNGAIARLATAR